MGGKEGEERREVMEMEMGGGNGEGGVRKEGKKEGGFGCEIGRVSVGIVCWWLCTI